MELKQDVGGSAMLPLTQSSCVNFETQVLVRTVHSGFDFVMAVACLDLLATVYTM